MNAIGWGGKTLEQVRSHPQILQLFSDFPKYCLYFCSFTKCWHKLIKTCLNLFQVFEDVSQCCQALSQRLGTQSYFFNKQYVFCPHLSLYTVMGKCSGTLQYFSNILRSCRLFSAPFVLTLSKSRKASDSIFFSTTVWYNADIIITY